MKLQWMTRANGKAAGRKENKMNARNSMKHIFAMVLALLLVAAAGSALACRDCGIQFRPYSFIGGQEFPVYSGPGYEYWRGANGRAYVTTDEPIEVAGWVGNWLLVRYQTSVGTRTGYIHGTEMLDPPYAGEAPVQDWGLTQITCDGIFTDDTSTTRRNNVGRVETGAYVTYLGEYYNDNSWAYVEGMLNGQLIRGFIPMSCLH